MVSINGRRMSTLLAAELVHASAPKGVKKNEEPKIVRPRLDVSFSSMMSSSIDSKKKRIDDLINSSIEGKQLTSTELSFIRDNAPEVYDKMVSTKNDRADIMLELLHCKSKGEVSVVASQHIERINAEISLIESSGLDGQQKKDAIQFSELKRAAIKNELSDFTSSLKYKSLK